jgi:putative ABC transport system substrate-binding protein
MKKNILIVAFLIVFIGLFYKIKLDHDSKKTVIGFVLPIEHKALDDIVQGFKSTLKENKFENVVIKVENAQSDLNLERAILEKMNQSQFKIVVPIGVEATQMALSVVKNKPIIGLATKFSQEDREKESMCKLSIVHDEIPMEKIFELIHNSFPNLKELTLVHSTAEKVYPEIPIAIESGKKFNIKVTPKAVTSMLDLMNLSQVLPSSTKGILILKDHMIVSGISSLVNYANKNKIPLITSDQGSVEAGADLALGVSEKEIGKKGALQAMAILQGKKPCSLPIDEISELSLFINEQSLKNKNISFHAMLHYGEAKKYHVITQL